MVSLENFLEFLNYTTVMCGLIGKIPQIQMLRKTKNTAGLSTTSNIIELIAFLIVTSYCAKQGYKLMSYLEMVAAVVQTLIFLALLMYYNKSLNAFNVGYILVILNAFYSFYLGYPHDKILDYLVAVVSVILASSKLVQLKELFRTKNSENISIFRWLLISYMSCARMTTNLLGTMDTALFISSTMAFVLNVTVVIVSLQYRKAAKETTGKSARRKAD